MENEEWELISRFSNSGIGEVAIEKRGAYGQIKLYRPDGKEFFIPIRGTVEVRKTRDALNKILGEGK